MTPIGQTARLRPALLVLAVLLYGAFSSPTPDDPGFIEALIGLLLILAVGIRQPVFAITGARAVDQTASNMERIGAAALALLFWLPLLRGVAMGWQPNAMLRDIVPLLYLFAPVLFGRLLVQDEFAQRLLAASLAGAGVLMSLRFFEISGLDPANIGRLASSDRLLYLPSSPCVLFGAIGLGVFAFRPKALISPTAICASIAAILGSLVCIGALAGTVQRGPLILATAAFLGFYGWRARRSALALFVGPAVLAGIAVALYQPAAGTFELIRDKTTLVGANARVDEFAAVLDQIGRHPVSLLFGDGWGALVASPAVGGLRVGYTHTFVSYVLLKTGLVGFIALLAYLAPVLRIAMEAAFRRPMLAFALVPPLALGATLTTSFKFLDYGLLLALLCAVGAWQRPILQRPDTPLLRAKTTC